MQIEYQNYTDLRSLRTSHNPKGNCITSMGLLGPDVYPDPTHSNKYPISNLFSSKINTIKQEIAISTPSSNNYIISDMWFIQIKHNQTKSTIPFPFLSRSKSI